MRPSRFRAARRAWEPYNVEVALDLIAPFAFDATVDEVPCLLYDYQTALEGTLPGRLGSGRSGVYRHRYLKGVGRTPAAANWNRPDDRYHGSGHLSVASALRERLITVSLTALGLDETIVGCETVLLRPLSRSELRAVDAGETSSQPALTPADATMAALTVKAADWARPANFVYGLENFCQRPQDLGQLFLELERFLRPPTERERIEGAPKDIASALEAAFEAGLSNFEAFARIGLQWSYTQSNFALDGRFIDLETPTLFGSPFVGLRIPDGSKPRLMGLEEFAYIRSWRLFIAWLRSRLEFLARPALLGAASARLFVRELEREIQQTFSRRHLLHSDAMLVRRAITNLSAAVDLGPLGRRDLTALAHYAMRAHLHQVREPLPALTWQAVDDPPAAGVPQALRYEAPGFLSTGLTPAARHFHTA